MRRELVPIVSPLINFARDRARRLPDEHAFPVPPDSMAICEAEFHLARKGLPHQTVKCLKETIGGKDASVAQQAQALLSQSLEARLPVDLLIFATLCRIKQEYDQESQIIPTQQITTSKKCSAARRSL